MKKILSDKSSAVIIFLVLTVFLQVLSFKILQIVIPEVIIADYANFMTKILMIILALEFAFFFWKTPLEINFEVFKVKKGGCYFGDHHCLFVCLSTDFI